MKKKIGNLKLYLVFWVFITLSLTVFFGFRFNEYSLLLDEQKKYADEIALEEEHTLALNKDKDYYESDAFIEKIAREQLGFIGQDEILFYNDQKDY